MSASTGPKVSIVIVSYNTAELLAKCLQSLRATTVPHEVIVVDNASADGTVDRIAPRYPEARWIANRENAGFARANNQAFAIATTPFWLVLNPDTEVRSGALEQLVAHLEAHPRTAVVGPEIERPDGRLEPSAGWVPSVGNELVETLLLFHLGLRGRMVRGPVRGPVLVDWVSGCAMLVRAAAANEVGHFDEGFFLYVEDLDWGYRFRKAGWAVEYLPGPRVLHRRGASVLQSDDTLVGGGDSMERLARKHRLPLPTAFLRVMNVVNLASRWALLWVRGLGGNEHARREAKVFARSLARVLGFGGPPSG